MLNFTEIVMAFIGLIGTLITALVVPLLKNKLTTAKQDELTKWVRIAVRAAEQIYGAQMGKNKNEYVLEWLQKNGFALDDEKVLAEAKLLIESFVAEMNGKASSLAMMI